MKRTNSLDLKFKPVKLFLEDLQEIESILKEIPNFEAIEISIEDQKFESVEEVCKYHQEVAEIDIVAKSTNYKSLSVSIRSYTNSIKDYNPDLETRGVAQKVFELLEKKEKGLILKIRSIRRTLGVIAWIVVLILPWVINDISKTSGLILLSVCLILLFSGLLTIFSKKSEIIFSNRKDRQSFWERRGEQMVTTLIIGLITTVLGFLLGKLF